MLQEGYSGMLDALRPRLKDKVIILGVGNTLRSDDGIGSILASRIKDKVSFVVWDVGVSPENYLDKIVKEKPDTLLIIDAVDFGAKPGEFRLIEAKDIRTVNLFFTHNASVNLVINYLQSHIRVDIIILLIQPKSIIFGDKLSRQVQGTLEKLESWFCGREEEVKSER